MNIRTFMLLGVCLVGLFAACSGDDSNEGGEGDVVTRLPTSARALLFALRGDAHREGDTLVVTASHVDWFTDRPAREAGRMSLSDFAASWERWGFNAVPPNADLISDSTDAVVVLAGGALDGASLRFTVAQTLDGELAEGDLGTVALFIDSTSDCATAMQGGSLNLRAANLYLCDLSGVDLSNSDFTQASLGGANLTSAILSHANFTGADISAADFSDATLIGANLQVDNGYDFDSHANYNVRFNGADLTDAKIWADWTGTSFVDATMTNIWAVQARFGQQTNMNGADVSGGDFTNALGLGEVNLSTTTFGEKVTCPDGTHSAYHSDSCQGAYGSPDTSTAPTLVHVNFNQETNNQPAAGVTVTLTCTACSGSVVGQTDGEGNVAIDVSTYANQGASQFVVSWSKVGWESGSDPNLVVARHETTNLSYNLLCPVSSVGEC